MTSESKSGVPANPEFLMPPENADLGQIHNQGNVRMWRPENHDDVEIVLMGFCDDGDQGDRGRRCSSARISPRGS